MGSTGNEGFEAERQRLLAEIETLTAQLETTLRAVTGGLTIYGPNGHLVRMNEVAERILGFTLDEWKNMSLEEHNRALHMETLDGRTIPLEMTPRYRALSGETVIGYRALIRRRDGHAVGIITSAIPISDAEGTVIGAVISFDDMG